LQAIRPIKSNPAFTRRQKVNLMNYSPTLAVAQPRKSVIELARSPRSDDGVLAALVTTARKRDEGRHDAALADLVERTAWLASDTAS
jgi:hypothetical protein